MFVALSLMQDFNDDKFFLKGGFFSYRSLTSVYEVENSLTYPFQYSYNFSGGKSINGYIEYQDRTKSINYLTKSNSPCAVIKEFV